MNGENGLPIDDAMVRLVLSGELDDGQGLEHLSRTALLKMLRRQGI